jgi:hypothetical protein
MLSSIKEAKENTNLSISNKESIINNQTDQSFDNNNQTLSQQPLNNNNQNINTNNNAVEKQEKNITENQPKQEVIVEQPVNQRIHISNVGQNPYQATNDSMLVNYEKEYQRFTFYDFRNNYLGNFTIAQLIKYIGSQIDNTFMLYIDNGLAENIITTMIGRIEKENNGIDIKLKNHLDSAFMGDIEMLIKLNNGLSEFEKINLENELLKVFDDKKKIQIRDLIKKFIYQLINYTLRVIAIISNEIKDDPIKETMKTTLLRYSVGLNYRLSNYVKSEISKSVETYNNLVENMNKLVEVKRIMRTKIDDLTTLIKEQNYKIEKIQETLKQNQYGGGSSTESEKKIKDKYTTITTENSESEDSEELNNDSESLSSSNTTKESEQIGGSEIKSEKKERFSEYLEKLKREEDSANQYSEKNGEIESIKDLSEKSDEILKTESESLSEFDAILS